MYPLIRQFLLYSLFLLVIGCGSNSPPSGSTSSNAVLFDPTSNSSTFVPLPNILASATARDPLTQFADAAGNIGPRPANTPMTPLEALAYVNLREMGGTNAVAGLNAPIYLRFTSPLDPATVTAANIKVFQLTPDSATPSATENNPLGFTDVTGMFTFQYAAGGTDLFLFPNFPLLPGTRYLYLVTNRVKDAASGGAVASSVYFDALKSTAPLAGAFASLEPIRADKKDPSGANVLLSGYAKVMNDAIAAAATTTVASRGEIALLGRFITSGAGFVAADAANAASRIPVESALRAFAAGAGLPGGLPGKTWANGTTLTATFDRGGTNPSPDVFWSAATGSATTAPASVGSIVTGTINSADLSVDPVVVAANGATMDLSAVTGAYNPAAGVVQPFRTGANLTGFYHVLRAVPFVHVAPAGTPPAGGWPLVIFQHGITGQKEQVIAVAGTLTAAGMAVVAIDLPLHGQLAVTGHTTGDLWGQDFMAIGAPLATRSNIEQAAFNLDRLEFTIVTGGFAPLGSSFTARPKFVGISLGSIVGAYYLAGNTTLATTGAPYTQTTLNSDMKGFLSVPGGRTAYLIQNSPAFSPSVNAGLAAKGIRVGSVTYNQFFLLTQSIIDPVDPATVTTPLAAGLPSRLSGRIVIQEATSTAFDPAGNPTDGDLVIPNANCRYFGNALGGREVLGIAGAAVAPAFKQLGYLGGATPRVPLPFIFTLAGSTPAPKVDFASALNGSATTPAEGYFQFDQTGITHAFLLDPRSSAGNTALAQTQMVSYLKRGVVVDPTGALPAASLRIPAVAREIKLPPRLQILGH
jgi:hypothetical protein